MSKELRTGYHEASITPDTRIALEGYEHRGAMGAGNAGVRDHLFVKSLSLRWEDEEILLITLDVCEYLPEVGARIRSAVGDRTGVPTERILISATHTHSGPVLDTLWGARDIQGDAKLRHDAVLSEYIDFLVETVATTAAESRINRFPVRVSGVHHTTVLGYNRRKRIGDGTGTQDKMLFGLWEHPGDHPEGVYDADVPVVMLERIREEEFDDYFAPRAPQRVILFNPAFHPVVLGQHSRVVSADYPGAACATISRFLGSGTKAMFFLGASGDTHPYISTQSNEQAVDVIGSALGAGIVAALADRRRLGAGNGVSAVERRLPLGGEHEGLIVQSFAFGDVAIVGVSAECFTELGIRVKERSPFRCTIIATLANGTMGYIPTQDAFGGGKYEVEIAENHGISPDTLTRLEDEILRQLTELREGGE